MQLPAMANCSIFYSSHQLDEVEKTASHLALLRDGRIRFQAAIGELAAQLQGAMHLDISDAARAQAVLATLGYRYQV